MQGMRCGVIARLIGLQLFFEAWTGLPVAWLAQSHKFVAFQVCQQCHGSALAQ